ncbi:hypothetical protein CO583_04650 [Parasaccharibacter sp. TMW2.1882]|uniref:FAD-binding domain-containing protein n=2 Tax=Acetobacteraceae TaxID=433 RepID=A0ABX4ZQ26_9PROT|nr:MULTISPECIES: tryptophan 7-halogenase [Acetobacteraceae]MCQ0041485.1 tryptophan 7-halogenase [Bombella sp.]MUG78846.1 hypothetical protein [Bombella sp. ESL0380]MUH02118.1 hypothetical protein [Bombella sp. ESL0387]MCK8636157.1 hypothetical protein [Parasaccharibacter sp. TMW2.1885]MCL1496802.1 hypothetical protein [Parasaccharibacter sp. TMW2.1882]
MYDVLIIGAGFAGLTLAYQLRKKSSDLRIAIVHDSSFPLDDISDKVGESFNEIGAVYFDQMLGLKEFMKERYPRKLGMRFFKINESSYQEMGYNNFTPNHAFHFERGKLENDLFDLVKDKVDFYLNHKYLDFETVDGEKHVHVLDRNDKSSRTLKAHWLVDAAGLKKLLARKFDLTHRLPLNHSSVWFRVGGGVNVDDFLPLTSDNPFTTENRSWSSIHLEGVGYWVWILRLSENVTSVGIIFDENMYEFQDLATWEKTKLWLRDNVRVLMDYLDEEQFPIMDFRILRRFATQSDYWVSDERWALVGDAYGIWDPYYSNGFDLIGMQNTILTELILAERAGQEIHQRIQGANRFISDVMRGFAATFTDFYSRKDRWYYICSKYNVDMAVYFPILATIVHNSLESMFVDEDPVFRDRVLFYLEEGGGIYFQLIQLLASDEFKNNGVDGYDYMPLNADTYHAFVPEMDIPYHEKERVFPILEKNCNLLWCVFHYLKSGRNYMDFIKNGAYFAITEQTDPERYRDNPDQLEADLFHSA